MRNQKLVRGVALGLVPLALGLGTGGRNIIRNGDFEKFTANEPTGWETTNIPNVLAVVSQSTKCHGGKYAVKCEVKDFYGTKMAGMLCLKDVTVNGATLQVKGFYLLHSVGNDIGFISIAFKNGNRAAIGSLEEFLGKSAADFVGFTKETPIPEGTATMDLHLTLLAGKGSDSLHEGSYVLFDDLQLVVAAEKVPPSDKQ